MSFTFDNTIPAAGNNPSNDQPKMLNNNIAESGIWNVDHIGFNAANGGTHQFVTFPSNPNYIVPAAPPAASNASVFFPKAGVAATQAQAFFQNANVTLPVSILRAWAFCNAGGIIATQSNNVTSVVRNSSGNYTVTLVANAVSTVDFGVLITAAGGNNPVTPILGAGYSITGIGVFNIYFSNSFGIGSSDPTNFTFTVYQL